MNRQRNRGGAVPPTHPVRDPAFVDLGQLGEGGKGEDSVDWPVSISYKRAPKAC